MFIQGHLKIFLELNTVAFSVFKTMVTDTEKILTGSAGLEDAMFLSQVIAHGPPRSSCNMCFMKTLCLDLKTFWTKTYSIFWSLCFLPDTSLSSFFLKSLIDRRIYTWMNEVEKWCETTSNLKSYRWEGEKQQLQRCQRFFVEWPLNSSGLMEKFRYFPHSLVNGSDRWAHADRYSAAPGHPGSLSEELISELSWSRQGHLPSHCVWSFS